MRHFGRKDMLPSTLALFTATGTLVCCALPALMVTLGMGAALAGIVTHLPQLIWLSHYKEIVFTVAGVLIAAAGVLLWKSRHMPCPADPAQARACRKMRLISLWVYAFSVLFFVTGFFFAFIAPYILIK